MELFLELSFWNVSVSLDPLPYLVLLKLEDQGGAVIMQLLIIVPGPYQSVPVHAGSGSMQLPWK